MESALDLVQEELNQIKAIGNAVGAIMFDGAGVDNEHIGTLCFLVVSLGNKMEDKLAAFECGCKDELKQ